ncbi:putative choline dehydrogenase [Xylogone sp. PMI_703]|nr:putative choline dehydrogenase [Xylogone sp. PMI_703]
MLNLGYTTALPTYDYIVVGSGPGGGPLAARLALAGYKVLLLDAGDDEGTGLIQEVPLLSLQSAEFQAQEWDYYVQHYDNQTFQETDSKMVWQLSDGEKYVGLNPPAGAKPLGIWYPRAGTLGGCARHNVMVTITPQNSDWENIMSITGDQSWNPDTMRQFWELLQDNLYLPNNTSGHGFNGWLETSLADANLFLSDNRSSNAIRAAATVVGSRANNLDSTLNEWLTGDVNNDSSTRDFTEGIYRAPEAVANAVNADGSRKYHLDVCLESFVTKIRFDQSNPALPKAIGVDFLSGQSIYHADPRSGNASVPVPGSVNATREVIISTGTFNTPQVLKLSGIGPAAELKQFGIPVVVDLPGVGVNLKDRYETSVVGQSTTGTDLFDGCTLLQTPNDPCLLRWQDNHTSPGIYSSNGVAYGIPKKSSVASADTADLLISGIPGNFFGYFPGYAEKTFGDTLHWAFIVLKAHSRNSAGTVTLASNNPRDTPNIHFRSYQDGGDEDIQAVYEGMQFARQIFANLSLLDDTFTEVVPGANVQTEQELKDFIKRESWGHHACCTAKIGADSDPMAVLDSKFRVRGTAGLRVVDASAFPEIPGYFIASAIYMISEKAAATILADA